MKLSLGSFSKNPPSADCVAQIFWTNHISGGNTQILNVKSSWESCCKGKNPKELLIKHYKWGKLLCFLIPTRNHPSV
jgi:hypothetical protein